MNRLFAGGFEKQKEWRRWLIAVLLCVAFASIASLPFFVIGEDPKVGCCGGEMPVTHDAWMHFNQMQAFARGIESGRIYPRWDEATHGFGAPVTNFYPPGIYYITSVFYFLTRDWRWAWVGFYWLSMTASALAFYWYARKAMSPAACSIATAVYVLAPYHLINQYQRGAMGEFFSFICLPLVLMFADELLKGNRMRGSGFCGLAASFGALLWTHPPTAYQFSLVFGSLFAVQAIARREWRGLLFILGAIGFGSMLAGAYFYPAIAEQHLINYNDVERTWPYHASYVYDFEQKTYDRIQNPFFGRLDCIWVFNLAVIALCALARMRYGERERPGLRQGVRYGRLRWLTLPVPHQLSLTLPVPYRLWIAAGLLASFLMTRYSAPIGRLIPKIEIGVFSWRMLTLTSFSMALLAGACVEIPRNEFNSALRRAARVVIPAIVLLGTFAMSAWYVVRPVCRGQAFEPNPAHYNFATLPRDAPREVPQMASVQFSSGTGQVMVEQWTPEYRELRVELVEHGQLQFRTFNFPGWTATIDGHTAEIKNGSARNIAVDVPAGLHRITLEFRSTPIRRVSNWITVLSSAFLFILGTHAILRAGVRRRPTAGEQTSA